MRQIVASITAVFAVALAGEPLLARNLSARPAPRGLARTSVPVRFSGSLARTAAPTALGVLRARVAPAPDAPKVKGVPADPIRRAVMKVSEYLEQERVAQQEGGNPLDGQNLRDLANQLQYLAFMADSIPTELHGWLEGTAIALQQLLPKGPVGRDVRGALEAARGLQKKLAPPRGPGNTGIMGGEIYKAVEAFVKKYSERLLSLPGVLRVGIGQTSGPIPTAAVSIVVDSSLSAAELQRLADIVGNFPVSVPTPVVYERGAKSVPEPTMPARPEPSGKTIAVIDDWRFTEVPFPIVERKLTDVVAKDSVLGALSKDVQKKIVDELLNGLNARVSSRDVILKVLRDMPAAGPKPVVKGPLTQPGNPGFGVNRDRASIVRMAQQWYNVYLARQYPDFHLVGVNEWWGFALFGNDQSHDVIKIHVGQSAIKAVEWGKLTDIGLESFRP